ncbi:hypothetical protein PspLS_00244 [Pyricularia sp. CBS 133598]|nr:hypothetical protein PspLS_00244 [Pyricularia sp. CBS 133598]
MRKETNSKYEFVQDLCIYSQTNPWVKPAYHYKAFQSSAAYSIFTELDPGTHAAHLRLLAPVFAQSRVTAADAQHLLWEKSNALISGIRDRNCNRIAEKEGCSDATVSLVQVFRSYALDIVTTWTFGRCAESLETFESDLFHVFDVAAESVIYFQHFPFLRALIPYIAPLFPKLVPNKLLGQYAAQALRDTRMRVEAGEIDPNQTVFSNLASAAWQEKRGYKPSEGQIISDGIVILAAGADTTAAALSVGMHHLARQPDLWRELQEELRPTMDMFDGRPPVEKLAQLPLLNAVLNEGLRLSCPIRGHMPRVVPTTGILCLHGDGTNASIFAAQTRHLSRALAPHNIELVHVTAPFECQAGFGVSPFFDDCGPFYRWFPRDEFDHEVDGPSAVAAAVETTNDLRYEYGDDRDAFVGILGFSSSAGIVAGILAAQNLSAEQPGLQSDVYYRFRFGVIINGTGMPLQFVNVQEGEYD